MLKLITAVVRPDKVEAVQDALSAVGGRVASATDGIAGARASRGEDHYRGVRTPRTTVGAVRLEVVADLFDAEMYASVVAGAARTGSDEDGLVWISDLDRVVRIDTGARDRDAL